MPQDGYIFVKAGSSNNFNMSLLSIGIYALNNIQLAGILLEEPYAEAVLSTPYLKKNTQISIVITMNANAWSYETRGNAGIYII